MLGEILLFPCSLPSSLARGNLKKFACCGTLLSFVICNCPLDVSLFLYSNVDDPLTRQILCIVNKSVIEAAILTTSYIQIFRIIEGVGYIPLLFTLKRQHVIDTSSVFLVVSLDLVLATYSVNQTTHAELCVS